MHYRGGHPWRRRVQLHVAGPYGGRRACASAGGRHSSRAVSAGLPIRTSSPQSCDQVAPPRKTACRERHPVSWRAPNDGTERRCCAHLLTRTDRHLGACVVAGRTGCDMSMGELRSRGVSEREVGSPLGWVNRPRRPPRQLLAPALHRCGEAATFWLVDAKLIGGEPVEDPSISTSTAWEKPRSFSLANWHIRSRPKRPINARTSRKSGLGPGRTTPRACRRRVPRVTTSAPMAPMLPDGHERPQRDRAPWNRRRR